MTPVLLVAGMLLGVFTPTEAAADHRGLRHLHQRLRLPHADLVQHLVFAAFETVKSTSAILIIVSAAALFGWILAIEQIPQTFAQLPAVAVDRSDRCCCSSST